MEMIKKFLRLLWKEWKHDDIMQRSAAVAYYTVFSLPALLLIVLSFASTMFDTQSVTEELFGTMQTYVGYSTAQLVRQTIEHVRQNSASSLISAIVGTLLLFFAGTGIIRTLQTSINKIMDLQETETLLRKNLLTYFISFILVVLTAAVLISTIIFSAIIAMLDEKFFIHYSVPPDLVLLIKNLITYGAIFILIFLSYIFLPAKKFPLLIVLLCSIITSSLLTCGTVLASYYVVRSNPGEAYGAAASVLILLFWIYFTANVFLFGAEMMDVSTRLHRE